MSTHTSEPSEPRINSARTRQPRSTYSTHHDRFNAEYRSATERGLRRAFTDNKPLAPDGDEAPTLAALAMHAIAVGLHDHMASHDLTQSQVAELTGVDQAAISRLLAGRNTITVATLAQLELGLGVSLYAPTAEREERRPGDRTWRPQVPANDRWADFRDDYERHD